MTIVPAQGEGPSRRERAATQIARHVGPSHREETAGAARDAEDADQHGRGEAQGAGACSPTLVVGTLPSGDALVVLFFFWSHSL